jgi:hypothetical protein
LGTASTAHAGGTVLRISGDDIYVDLGANDGVGAGTKLTLMHAIVAIHPVTKKKIRDLFPIGVLTVTKAGAKVCIARAPKAIKARVKIGDEIKLASARRRFVDPWKEQVERSKQPREPVMVNRGTPSNRKVPSGPDAHAQAEAVKRAWKATLGKPPRARVAVWSRYLAAHPRSPYTTSIRAEIARLQVFMREIARIDATRTRPESRRRAERAERLRLIELGLDLSSPVVMRPLGRVIAGQQLDIAFTVLAESDLSKAWLYYRTVGDKGYRRAPLRFDGDGYLRGTIPGNAVGTPGLQLFVEATSVSNDVPKAVLGSQQSPLHTKVESAVVEAPPERANRSRVTLFTDYVDFDGGFGGGFDQYVHAEIDFMYRFYHPIYSLRVGFGTLSGTGGPKNIIDESDVCRDANGRYQCRRVSYNFAYTEIELRYSEMLAFMIRPQFGTGTSDRREDASGDRCLTGELDSDCEFFSSFGMRGRARIGKETETNLVLGIGFTQNVGTMIEAAFTWDVMPRFPVVLSFQVTDQPVPEDFGVRLIADVGWRTGRAVYPSVRLAYQARDLDHAGISGGLALNFDW